MGRVSRGSRYGFLGLYSAVFLTGEVVGTVVGDVSSATGTSIVRLSIPSVCGTSVSDNDMGISPLIFRDTFATPGSPETLTMRDVVPWVELRFVYKDIVFQGVMGPSTPVDTTTSSSSFPSTLDANVVSLSACKGIAGVMTDAAPNVTGIVLAFIPGVSLGRLVGKWGRPDHPGIVECTDPAVAKRVRGNVSVDITDAYFPLGRGLIGDRTIRVPGGILVAATGAITVGIALDTSDA